MYELPEEVEDFLEEEKVWCMENLRFLNEEINELVTKKNECYNELLKWKERYEKTDRKLAFATKLTVVGIKRETKDPSVRALEKVLKDPSQAQALIDLLREDLGLTGANDTN